MLVSYDLHCRKDLAQRLAYSEGSASNKNVSTSSELASPIALEAFTEEDGSKCFLLLILFIITYSYILFPLILSATPYVHFMEDDEQASLHSSFEEITYSVADEAERENLQNYLKKVCLIH